ncbi:MAG: hypothetical protein M1546_23895, partial [Chloroflexi bacterium]|nr:hypothetical protein [Chloroflexota bacterium]
AALCKIAVIGVAQMRYGWCGEAMLAASTSASLWSDVHGQSQASYLRNRYASFSATTLRGTLVFTGSGTIVASAAEQRAIAEWALNRFEAANVNYLAADYGQRLFWQEASQTRCGSVWVFQTGLALAWNCSGTAVVATDFLTPAQMQQFYKWIDSGTTWNIMRIGPNGQRISLSLWSNPGGQLTVRTDTENMLGFANDVYEQLTAEDSEP